MRRVPPVASIAALVLVAACSGGPVQDTAGAVAGGDASRGEAIIRAVGCGSCHEIGQIRTARGLVGPPLEHMGRRTTIAGVLPNTPENLVRWVMHPQAVQPGTAMPDLGLDEAQAQDVTAFLYTRD